MLGAKNSLPETIQDKSPQTILEEVKQFVSIHIRPYAAEFEEKEGIPRQLIDKMAERGYLAACFPKMYGGLGLDPIHYGLFTEEIGKACSSTRAMLTVHTSLVGQTILRWGTEEQKDALLPAMAKGEKLAAFALTEPSTGTDTKNIQTSYRKEGNHFIIHGKKKWITLSGIADVFLVIAKNENNISAFLVDRKSEGIRTTPIKGLLASRAVYVAEIEFDQVRIPEENLLGKEGAGSTYIINSALDYGRFSVAWGGLGIAQEALEAMISYSRKRKAFGEKIYNFQFIQGMIGNAITKIHAGRSLCLHAGKLRKERHNDAIMETTIAKYFTSTI
ncbi:MAG: acyl-CoA dehydrogenase family protein, partial [Bacteroidota bacterium]